MQTDETAASREDALTRCHFRRADKMTAPAIVLANPKYPHNVGQVFRMAADYLIGEIWVCGQRIKDATDSLGRIPREERLRGYRDVRLIWDENPLSKLPSDCTPVAVEFRPNAENLYDFAHPDHPIYLFGPEDGTLDRAWLTACHRFVRIDTAHCLNLSAAVGTVLYDRMLKQHLSRRGITW